MFRMLSESECQTLARLVLQSDRKCKILNYEFSPLNLYSFNSHYFLVQIYIAYLDDCSNREIRLIAKNLNGVPDIVKLSKEIDSVERMKFFNLTPEVYLTRNDTFMVFEDFLDNGFVLPSSRSLDMQHVQLALETLARYHVAGIHVHPNKNFVHYSGVSSTWFKSGFNTLCSFIEGLSQTSIENRLLLTNLTKLYKESKNLLQILKSYQKVLCHGYLWGTGVLFSYQDNKPTQCKFVNTELQHINCPAYDVLHFLYKTLTPEMRQKHFKRLLRFYYDCLQKEEIVRNLNQIISRDEFEMSVHLLNPIIKLEYTCFRQLQFKTPSALTFDIHEINNAFRIDQQFSKLLTESIVELNEILTHRDITIEDCYEIIETAIGTNNYKLLQHNLKPLGRMGGFLGDHKKLEISLSLPKETITLHLFSKFMPKADTALMVVLDSGAFAKEIFIYKTFFPELQRLGISAADCAVPCYFSRYYDVIIFEDFEFLGYKPLDPRTMYSYETLVLVIKRLAKFHASSIILEDKMSRETSTTYSVKQHFQIFQEGLYTTIKSHKGREWIDAGIASLELLLKIFPEDNPSNSDEKLLEKIKIAFETMFDLVKESDEFRNVICHGDLWINNILIQIIDDIPTDCRFIDFQLIRYCPPAHDILAFIYFTSSRTVRQTHFADLIDAYYKEFKHCLASYGVDINDIYPYSTFLKSIKLLIPHAVCQKVLYYQIILINQDVFKNFIVNEEIFDTVFLKDRTEYILYMYKNDRIFRKLMADAVQDLREMCIEYY